MAESRWVLVPQLKARAEELWADPANYTYDHIARILNVEFAAVCPASCLGLTKGIMSKFYFDSGTKRYTNASGGRPKPRPRKTDVRAARRGRAKAKAEYKRAHAIATAVPLEHVEREAFAPASGLWPSKPFELARWGKPTKSLRKLNSADCKWPFEDEAADVTYCGCRATVMVYCLHHASLAYRAAPSEERNATGGKGGFDEDRRAHKVDLEGSDDKGHAQGERYDGAASGEPSEARHAGDADDDDTIS